MTTPNRVPIPVFVAVVAILTALCVLLAGCTNLPFARTYSLNYSDGKQTVGGSVRFEPAPIDYRTLKHDGKTIVPPDDLGPKQSYHPDYGVNFGVPPGWKGREKEWQAAGSPPFNPGDGPAPAASPRQ